MTFIKPIAVIFHQSQFSLEKNSYGEGVYSWLYFYTLSGFLCPVHTPDGSPCGLLNHLTALAGVSLYVKLLIKIFHNVFYHFFLILYSHLL